MCGGQNYCSSKDMAADCLRHALLGSIRYGKICVVDVGDISVSLDTGTALHSVHYCGVDAVSYVDTGVSGKLD